MKRAKFYVPKEIKSVIVLLLKWKSGTWTCECVR